MCPDLHHPIWQALYLSGFRPWWCWYYQTQTRWYLGLILAILALAEITTILRLNSTQCKDENNLPWQGVVVLAFSLVSASIVSLVGFFTTWEPQWLLQAMGLGSDTSLYLLTPEGLQFVLDGLQRVAAAGILGGMTILLGLLRLSWISYVPCLYKQSRDFFSISQSSPPIEPPPKDSLSDATSGVRHSSPIARPTGPEPEHYTVKPTPPAHPTPQESSANISPNATSEPKHGTAELAGIPPKRSMFWGLREAKGDVIIYENNSRRTFKGSQEFSIGTRFLISQQGNHFGVNQTPSPQDVVTRKLVCVEYSQKTGYYMVHGERGQNPLGTYSDEIIVTADATAELISLVHPITRLRFQEVAFTVQIPEL